MHQMRDEYTRNKEFIKQKPAKILTRIMFPLLNLAKLKKKNIYTSTKLKRTCTGTGTVQGAPPILQLIWIAIFVAIDILLLAITFFDKTTCDGTRKNYSKIMFIN